MAQRTSTPGNAELAQTKKLRALLPLITVLKAAHLAGDELRGNRGRGGSPYVWDQRGGRQLRRRQWQKLQGRAVPEGEGGGPLGAGDAFGSGFVAALAGPA